MCDTRVRRVLLLPLLLLLLLFPPRRCLGKDGLRGRRGEGDGEKGKSAEGGEEALMTWKGRKGGEECKEDSLRGGMRIVIRKQE